MNLQEAFQELSGFKRIMENELTKIGNVEYDERNKEERFLFAHYQGIISDMDYIIESIDYINKPSVIGGIINLQNQKLYINSLELKDGDSIEVLFNDEWQQVDIFKINGKYREELLKDIINMYGKIRLTEKEAKDRL